MSHDYTPDEITKLMELERPRRESAQVYQMYKNGWGVQQIADKYNVSVQTIYSVLRSKKGYASAKRNRKLIKKG